MKMWCTAIALTMTVALMSGARPVALETNVESAPTRYDDHKVIRVYPRTRHDLDLVGSAGGMLLSCHESLIETDYVVSPHTLQLIEMSALEFDLLNDNIQKDIDAERARLDRAGTVHPRDAAWFDEYKTNDEINAFTDALVLTYPELVSKSQIGTSYLGRPIYALTITSTGGSTTKAGVCLNGLQHAREWVSPMTVLYIAERLLADHATDPQVQSLLDELIFYIIPVVNPDGYEYAWDGHRLWRKNRHGAGVDCNRNWGYQWGGPGSSGSSSSDTYRGAAPFSEPETQAVRDFILARPEIRAHIDFHSYSQLVLWPFGHGYVDPPEPDYSILSGLAETMSLAIWAVHGKYYVPQPGYELYLASGTANDWAYGAAGVFSWTFELRPRTINDGGFMLPADEILATAEENYPAVLSLANFVTQRVGFVYPDGKPTVVIPEVSRSFPVTINSQTETAVPGTERLFYRIGSSGPYTETSMVSLGEDRFEIVLPPVAFGDVVQFYVEVDTASGQTVRNPLTYESQPHEAIGGLLAHDFPLDMDPGWTTEGDWTFGDPYGYGGQYGDPDPDNGYTGANVYGYKLNGDYPSALPETHLTSTPIDCSDLTNVGLRYRRWLGVQGAPFDHAYVQASNDGVNWVKLWSARETISDTAWVEQWIDLSFLADNQPTVYLRWTMGETDGWEWYCGWNIDDIEIWAVGPQPCPADLTDDLLVDTDDFLAVLAEWGGAGSADVNGDGVVNADDFLAVLATWGPCP